MHRLKKVGTPRHRNWSSIGCSISLKVKNKKDSMNKKKNKERRKTQSDDEFGCQKRRPFFYNI